VKLPSYTINGTPGHHFTPNVPRGVSIRGQKLGPFMSNQACKPQELFSLACNGISKAFPPLGRWMHTATEEFRRRRQQQMFL
jgi:hypothetical protein